MSFSRWILESHKQKIVSDKPHPIIPFILGIIFFLIGFFIKEPGFFRYFVFFLGLFTFVFAIIHLSVVRIIKSKSKRKKRKKR